MLEVAISELLDQRSKSWKDALSERAGRMRSSAIREMLKVTMQPDFIALAGGLPAPELFPIQEFKDACEHVLEHNGSTALQYGPTGGYPPLRELLATSMQKHGVAATPDNILITSGSQQALDLIGRLFIDPGDEILTDAPTYVGAIQAWQVYGPQFVTVPLDDDGMDPDRVEEALQNHRIKFMYVLPNFQNPAGTTIPYGRRQRLIELAGEYGALIVEDDPYGQLRFRGEDIPSLISMDGGNVIYLSTFSKILSPGIRLGWIVAPEEMIAHLVTAKQGADLHTNAFVQCVVREIVERGFIERHVPRLCAAYKERCDAMLAAAAEHFPPGVTWTHPQGGLFLWAQMPERIDVEDLLAAAIEEKVAFVPGTAFYPDGEGGRHSLRLNFSNARPEMIREGMQRLGQAMSRALE